MSDAPPVRTAEDLQSITVAPIKRLPGGKVEIVDYDPTWPATFEREAARVRRTLGERVRLLEHGGSTSVPGLPAKPIIDMVLALPDSSDEASYVPDMEAAGYVLRIREPDWYEHRVFKGPDANINLHVFTVGAAEIQKMLTFRDWLRTHPEELDLYRRTKLELASREWEFVQHYADAKPQVIEGILARAGWHAPDDAPRATG